jgi:NitT/TauT family transport system substrate-binding protein
MNRAVYELLFPRPNFVGLLSAAAVGAFALIAATWDVRAADQITIQLDFTYIRGNYAPFFIARDKGMFKEQDIQVTDIRMGRGSADTSQRVAQGTSEFGFADLPTVMVVRSQGAPVVAIAAVNVISPLAMLTLRDRAPLKKPKDLEGLSIAVTPALSTYYFFRAFAAANGVDLSKVTEVSATPPYEPLVLAGRVTALPGYIDAEIPILAAHAGGIDKLDILRGEDYGYKAFGTGVITNDRTLRDKPQLIERFMRAYLKAFRHTIDNPNDAVDLLMKVDPKLDRQILLAQLDADIKYTFTNQTTEQCGLGYMDPKRWESTREVLVSQKVIATAPKLEDLYTNRFLGGRCPQ